MGVQTNSMELQRNRVEYVASTTQGWWRDRLAERQGCDPELGKGISPSMSKRRKKRKGHSVSTAAGQASELDLAFLTAKGDEKETQMQLQQDTLESVASTIQGWWRLRSSVQQDCDPELERGTSRCMPTQRDKKKRHSVSTAAHQDSVMDLASPTAKCGVSVAANRALLDFYMVSIPAALDAELASRGI